MEEHTEGIGQRNDVLMDRGHACAGKANLAKGLFHPPNDALYARFEENASGAHALFSASIRRLRPHPEHTVVIQSDPGQ